jgi:hypothetical protein
MRECLAVATEQQGCGAGHRERGQLLGLLPQPVSSQAAGQHVPQGTGSMLPIACKL